jgi:hypothetical protein
VTLSAGRFLVPSTYERNPIVAKFVRLFGRVAGRLGAEVVYCDDIHEKDLPSDCPFVVVLKPVQLGRSGGFRGLLGLPRRIRVLGLWDDIHQGPGGTRYFSRNRRTITRFFRRCDAILCTYRDPFLRWYPRYADRLVHFPHFLDLDDFASVPFNPAPMPKCVLSGALGSYYPLRNYAARNPDVVVMAHPGYGAGEAEVSGGFFGPAYARELARYRCAVTCSLVIGYAVAKFVELPAAGCLLLANDTPDLEVLGLRDGVNYVRVGQDTFDRTLADVLARPEAFEPIRRAGFDLARARHTDRNRADQLEQVIRALCESPRPA